MNKRKSFIPLPDISGVGFIKDKPVKMLNISTLVRRAHYASSLDEDKRKTNERMDIAAWNLTWRCLKRSNPALASLISDPNVKEIMGAFNGELKIEL